MKGSIFTGNKPIDDTAFSAMNPDQQLQATKEWGMMFNYLNRGDVWAAFCSAYEAIYTLMGQFDTWYNVSASPRPIRLPVLTPSQTQGNPGDMHPSNLQAEWQTYVRVVLDNIALRARTNLDYAYQHRTAVPANWGGSSQNALYEFKWYANIVNNRLTLNLPNTCPNLGGTTIPIATSGNPDS